MSILMHVDARDVDIHPAFLVIPLVLLYTPSALVSFLGRIDMNSLNT